ncbi:MAG: hypothetical protein ACYDDB_05300 [bacterium]
MSINNISNPYRSYIQNGFSQMQSDFQQLGQALRSGNMSAAQQNYLTIQQLFGQNQGASPVDSASNSNPGLASAQGLSTDSSLNSGSSSDNNIVGRSMQTVISQYLSNSIVGGLLGGSGLLSNVLGSININV